MALKEIESQTLKKDFLRHLRDYCDQRIEYLEKKLTQYKTSRTQELTELELKATRSLREIELIVEGVVMVRCDSFDHDEIYVFLYDSKTRLDLSGLNEYLRRKLKKPVLVFLSRTSVHGEFFDQSPELAPDTQVKIERGSRVFDFTILERIV